MKHYTPQMLALMEAIASLRLQHHNGLKGELVLDSVVKKAQGILIAQAEANGTKPLTVTRQSLYSKNSARPFASIKKAINGTTDNTVPDDVDVEEVIHSFNSSEVTNDLKKEILALEDEVKEKEKEIKALLDSRKEFEEKAFSKQYFTHLYNEDMVAENDQLTSCRVKLTKEEKLRKEYQVQNKKLRNELETLKKHISPSGLSESAGGTTIHKNLSPSIHKIHSKTEDGRLLTEYSSLREESWNSLLSAIKTERGSYIYLIFHRFNIKDKEFIEKHISFLPGRKHIVFSCYQPISRKRKQMYQIIKESLLTQPTVFIAHGDHLPNDNVTHLDSSKRDMIYRLKDNQAARFNEYDIIEEAFDIVKIVRKQND